MKGCRDDYINPKPHWYYTRLPMWPKIRTTRSTWVDREFIPHDQEGWAHSPPGRPLAPSNLQKQFVHRMQVYEYGINFTWDNRTAGVWFDVHNQDWVYVHNKDCHCASGVHGTRDGVTHVWELPGNYPVFTMVMVIYHYADRIWRILVTRFFVQHVRS